jgi:hypothetical protein
MRLAWHRRQRQELRRQRCTARRIGGCDNHCDDNDEQHDRASHGRHGRDVRYARTIKETQAKPASLIPPEPTTRNLLAGFFVTVYKKAEILKILPRISVERIDLSVRPCVRVSGKWSVGPSSTRNRATCFFISLGDTGRCYGVSLCRADASDQRRARCWLPFFGDKGRDSSSLRTEHVGALLALKLSRCMLLSQGLGARQRLFPSVRISVRAVALYCAHHVSQRAEPSQACDSKPNL